MACRIEDYALIGDCETAALVGRDGCIDWLCWPRFDSDACFAGLLGTRDNGCWRLAPTAPTGTTRRYRSDTLVLETDYETAGGAVTVLDFMPLRSGNSDLVRIVIGRRGQVRMRSELSIRFSYGATVPWVTRRKNGDLLAIGGPHQILLRTPVAIHGEGYRTVAEFSIGEGEQVPFVLTHAPSHLPLPEPVDPLKALADTEVFWRDWAAGCGYKGPWSEAVRRSLITLKALTYRPTGGIVAAATTSLPEAIGGVRNWDYRFCWLRDSTFTLLALMDAGHTQEARAWRDWLLRASAGAPAQMQIMYGLAGERLLPEMELPWLDGYEGSKPVRIGNAAATQHQLDIYGEVADALFQAHQRGLNDGGEAWALQRALLRHVEEIWREPDEGIWEVRGGRQHFVHSKVMAWVAFDRAIQAADAFGYEGPVDEWRRIRQQIHDEVCSRGFDQDLNSFVQAYVSKQLDASLLLLPLVGFLPPHDARVRGTVEAIERHLMAGGLVKRYDTAASPDGLPPGEGAFLACSFWLVDNLVLLGRHDDAKALFERLLTVANDVGLLAEEFDPASGRMLGNFPQAFSHVGLINSALNLSRIAGPAEERSASRKRHNEATHRSVADGR